MSWLSSGIHKLGHLAEKAAPYVGMIPGVGTLAGGVIGGVGGLAAGDGLSGALKYGLQGAAGGAAGGGLRSAISGAIMNRGGSGPPTDANGVPQVMRNGLPASVGDLITGGAPEDASSQGGGGVGGFLRGAVNSVTGADKNGQGGVNPWLMGLAGLEGANSAYLGNKANKYSDQALQSVKDSYAARAGLRSKGISGLMNPQARDTSNLTSIRSSNPYALPLARTA